MHGLLRLLVADPLGMRTLELDDGTDVSALVERLGASGMAWLVAVNGEAASRKLQLRDGDRVDIYPSLEGG